jgi:hypothetical protein
MSTRSDVSSSTFLESLKDDVPDLLSAQSIHSLRLYLLVEAASSLGKLREQVVAHGMEEDEAVDAPCLEEIEPMSPASTSSANDVQSALSFCRAFDLLHMSQQMLVCAIYRRHLTLPTHILVLDWHKGITHKLNKHFRILERTRWRKSRGFTTNEFARARIDAEKALRLKWMERKHGMSEPFLWHRLEMTELLEQQLASCTDYHRDKFSLFYLLSPDTASRQEILEWLAVFFQQFVDPPTRETSRSVDREPLDVGVELIDFPLVTLDLNDENEDDSP